MKILDWYILKKLLSTFFFVVFILIVIICVIDFTEKNDEYIEHQLTWPQILGYYLDFIPFVASLITPITVFIATVFITAQMAGKSEIIAILSSGVSFQRMMLPYLIGSFIITIISFYLNGWVIPNSNKDRVQFERKYIEDPFRFNERHVHIKIAPNTYAYMERYDNSNKVGYRFTLETIEDDQLREKLSANRITWDTASNKWTLNNWSMREFEGFQEKVEEGQRMDTTLNIKPEDFSNTYKLQETLTLNELNAHIKELKSRGADNVMIFQVEEYIRYMTPFTAIILTIIGLIMSARKTRGGSGFQIALGFAIAFVFILFFILARTMAEAGSMEPLLAVWLPNITFTVVAFVLYKTVPR